MGDSSLSASELRKRYLAGGSLSDDQLTAAQLRARAGITSNARDFSSKDNAGGSPMQGLLILTIAVGAIAAVVYLIWGASGGKK